MTLPDRGDMLSPLSASQILGVSRSLVYLMISTGELHAVRVRYQWRIHGEEVSRYLEKHRGKCEWGRSS